MCLTCKRTCVRAKFLCSCAVEKCCVVRGSDDQYVMSVFLLSPLDHPDQRLVCRGTGVRAMGPCSRAVKTCCVISGNGWHGASAVEGGHATIESCTLSHNGGAGFNAFAEVCHALSKMIVVHKFLDACLWSSSLDQLMIRRARVVYATSCASPVLSVK